MSTPRPGEPKPALLTAAEAHRLWRLIAYKMAKPPDLKDLDVVEDVLMGSGLGPGAIAAIVIVSLLVVAGSIIGGICYYKKKRSCNTVAILTDADNKDLEAGKS